MDRIPALLVLIVVMATGIWGYWFLNVRDAADRYPRRDKPPATRHSERIRVAVLVFFVNFALFLLIGTIIGGDSVNVPAIGDTYWVTWHGKYTEVPRSIWLYSRIHALSLGINALVVGYLFKKEQSNPPGQ
jgi:hypothetical protein